MVAWPLTFALSGPLSSDPPVPIAATLAFATGAWSVQFDKPLQPGVLAFANWTFVATATDWTATSAVAAGDTVSGAATSGGFPPPGDVANYAATPADVLDLEGRPAAAFINFPLVVT